MKVILTVQRKVPKSWGCLLLCNQPIMVNDVPIWIANYVLYEYGTGAVIAMPEGDERDWEFAKKYNLPVKITIQNPEGSLKLEDMENAYTEEGVLVDSGNSMD